MHPDGSEQQLMWMMNRARQAPGSEGVWLAHLRQPNVQSAMNYFDVDREILMAEFAALSGTPPSAFDRRLYLAALDHSNYLISIDGQNHNQQFDRIDARGFQLQSARGSVFSYTKDAVHGHGGFNIDWGGNDGTGMQSGRGHRAAIMGTYANTGVACVPETDPTTDVGPMVTTINYCNAQTYYGDHYNRFIVGTVWKDLNTNALYDPGEGLDDITVMPDSGTYFAVTGRAGGYAIPVDPGTYQVTFSGTALDSTRVISVQVGAESELMDLRVGMPYPDPEVTTIVDVDQNQVDLTISQQMKGASYRLMVSTNLLQGAWEWTGELATGYGTSIQFSAPFLMPGQPSRYLSLESHRY